MSDNDKVKQLFSENHNRVILRSLRHKRERWNLLTVIYILSVVIAVETLLLIAIW